MVGYIYKITNLINGKVYIGKHAHSTFDKRYWGSGTTLLLAYNKYGHKNFKREVICGCETIEELNKQEIYGIKGYRDRDFICYNITNGGDGGEKGNIPGNKGKKNCYSDETKTKISKKLKGRKLPEEHRKNISLHLVNKKKVLCDDVVFDSISDCARYLKVAKNHLGECLKRGFYKNHKLEIYNGRQ